MTRDEAIDTLAAAAMAHLREMKAIAANMQNPATTRAYIDRMERALDLVWPFGEDEQRMRATAILQDRHEPG